MQTMKGKDIAGNGGGKEAQSAAKDKEVCQIKLID